MHSKSGEEYVIQLQNGVSRINVGQTLKAASSLNICVCYVHDQNDMNKTKQGLQFQYIYFTTI